VRAEHPAGAAGHLTVLDDHLAVHDDTLDADRRKGRVAIGAAVRHARRIEHDEIRHQALRDAPPILEPRIVAGSPVILRTASGRENSGSSRA
jgi:hypothetical protein